ncbi:MAG: MFS transporter [Pseudomonadota bacterium]
MYRSIVSITALLIAAAILYAGNGLQGTLLAVRGNLEGFSPGLIGALMSAYYFGFIVGCRVVPGFIQSVGHIRTFVAVASIASSSALAHAVFVDPVFWAGLRAATGFCFARLAMVLESWINDRATNQNRERILSVYRIVDLSALTLGNLLLATASPSGFVLFALVSILISLSLVPVAMTQMSAPAATERAKLDIAKLYKASPVAAAGAVSTGLANAAFWGVAALFVQGSGFSPATVGTFFSVAIVAAAITQLPLGWFSDIVDRRWVMLVLALASAAASVLLAHLGSDSKWLLLSLGALFGAVTLPVYGVSAAHAADFSKPGEGVTTSASMLMLHGLGAVAGAGAGGIVIAVAGPDALFIYIGVVQLTLGVFCFARTRVRKAKADDKKRNYVPAPRSPQTRTHPKRNAQTKPAGNESHELQHDEPAVNEVNPDG